jgi:hypothetical protein
MSILVSAKALAVCLAEASCIGVNAKQVKERERSHFSSSPIRQDHLERRGTALVLSPERPQPRFCPSTHSSLTHLPVKLLLPQVAALII